MRQQSGLEYPELSGVTCNPSGSFYTVSPTRARGSTRGLGTASYRCTLAEECAVRAGSRVRRMPVKILISDDSPVFRRTLRQLLESVDQWQVIETRDGGEAVTQAITTLPDVVVLDLAMPVKDGLTAAREIAQALPGTPILICTMHKAPQMELEAQKAGARGTLSKENSTAIVPAIHQLLNEKRAQAANSSANETPGETGRSSAHEARGESPSNHKRPTSPDPKS